MIEPWDDLPMPTNSPLSADELFSSVRAAQYVRMSTELQKYSIQNQADAIAAYAARHGITIVHSYEDAGRSGLRINGRQGLKDLIADIRNGNANFDRILVYDVSRWGRFQDADESAYYEFIYKQAGTKVEYCAEAFENDGSLMSSILKTLKRVMAAEFSRELSVKVFAGLLLRRYFHEVVGQRKDMMFSDMTPVLPLTRSGQLRALATITKDRSALFSELPSVQEQGLDFRNLSAWTGMFAPKGAPPEAIEKLSGSLREIMAEPAIRQRLAEIGFEAQWIAPKEFAKRIAADIELWATLTKETGIERQ
jgi:predicted site-specific integrase-resolvase